MLDNVLYVFVVFVVRLYLFFIMCVILGIGIASIVGIYRVGRDEINEIRRR